MHNNTKVVSMAANLPDQWSTLTGSTSWPGVELVEVPGAGRGLVTTREVVAGERVLVDLPTLTGPSEQSSSSDCSGCYITRARTVCVCGLGFCTDDCKDRYTRQSYAIIIYCIM